MVISTLVLVVMSIAQLRKNLGHILLWGYSDNSGEEVIRKEDYLVVK